MATRARPLSPHLQIYRPQLTSLLSITHRATGVALSAGSLLLVWGLVALAAGPEAWHEFAQLMSTVVGRLVVAAFVFSLVYHWLNGLRHLAWDTGWGLDLKRAYATGWSLVVLAPLLTALILWRLWI
ncbi:MAG: succinate dehydrogenase, cytochrome b556 subunit [Lysobacterales bacterium]|nr:succinate dehydrogenase, cytochrome b556 subunit [Xanthomonadales bacterium]MCB1610267.1 succinate dehydrogenase, cytochrome b556 subunit [Xanthomonadales bacterium]MCP5474889.1 succinate dehydrogenase, cytochrome b556 subunit [Rhodanobacteraceae bacterium]